MRRDEHEESRDLRREKLKNGEVKEERLNKREIKGEKD